MIALDTNIIIRYIVQDDKAQAEIATRIIESLTVKDPAFITNIVLCEVNWVLKSTYKISKQDRLEFLEKIFSIAEFEIENIDILIISLRKYRAGKADLSDYIIAETAKCNGCKKVITFDKKAGQEKDFELAL